MIFNLIWFQLKICCTKEVVVNKIVIILNKAKSQRNEEAEKIAETFNSKLHP